MSQQPPIAISHETAQALISARMDALLTSAENQLLLTHLTSCAECRAFAVQMEIMGAELRALPTLASNPAVSSQFRQLLEQERPRHGGIAGLPPSRRFGALPMAAIALLMAGTVGALLIMRSGDDQTVSELSAPGTTVAFIQPTLPVPSPTEAAVVDAARSDNQGSGIAIVTIPNITVSLTNTPSQETTAGEESDQGVIVVTADNAPTSEATSTSNNPKVASEPTTESKASIIVTPVASASVKPTLDVGQTLVSTDVPTATFEPSLESTGTSTPTDTPSATPTPTLEPTKIDTPTQEPTATLEPTETDTPTQEPTATLEPTETDTPTQVPTATLEPTATETPTEEPSATLVPTEMPTAMPAPSLEPTETDVPEDGLIVPVGGADQDRAASVVPESSDPAVAPTIAPISGSEPVEEQLIEEPAVAPTEPDPVEAEPVATVDDADSSQTIVATDATEASGFEPVEGTGGVDPNTSVEESVGGSGLDRATSLVTLPAGTFAPSGQLELEPESGEVFVVISPSGSLAVADMGGAIRTELGFGSGAVWSDSGGLMAFTDSSRSTPSVAVFNSVEGVTYLIATGSAEEGRTIDIAAGFVGTNVIFQRTFVDQPGRIELHAADSFGGGDSIIWSSEGFEPTTARPIVTPNGVLIASSVEWILVSPDGSSTLVGANPFGTIGPGVVSPGGSMVAYESGGLIHVADVFSPGSPFGSGIPYAGNGFAFSPEGDRIIVSDGTSLVIYSSSGEVLGIANSTSGAVIGSPLWRGDGIYFVEQGDPSLLRLVDPEQFTSP